MRPAPRVRRRLRMVLGLLTMAGLIPLTETVRAAAPVVTITPTGARVQVSSATLAETIDALARVAGFKVTYDGARPSAMLFNAEVDTPTVAHTLTRLLEGQNLDYGIVFDLSGTKVTALMIFGTASNTSGSAGGGSTPARPQPFATPRNPRATMPPVDDDPSPDPDEWARTGVPAEQGAPAAATTATPAPSPAGNPTPPPAGMRPLFGAPLPARPSPTP